MPTAWLAGFNSRNTFVYVLCWVSWETILKWSPLGDTNEIRKVWYLDGASKGTLSRTGILVFNTVRSWTDYTELHPFVSFNMFQKTSFPIKTDSILLPPDLPVRRALMKFLPDEGHECSIVLRRRTLTTGCLVWAKRLGATWANQLSSLEKVISPVGTVSMIGLGIIFNNRIFYFYYLSHHQ